MNVDIQGRPSYAMLVVEMDEGDRIMSKTGAMVSRTAEVEVDSNVGGDGGITGTIKRAVSDEQDVVENVFTAGANGQRVTLAPEEPGDVVPLDLDETGRIVLPSGSVVAWEETVEKDTDLGGLGGLMSTGELTMLALSGSGLAYLSAVGEVYERPVSPGEPLVTDEDHLVAWTDGLEVSRSKDGSIKSSLLGGEGFVTRFEGEGRVWLQTQDPSFFQVSAGGGGGAGGGDVDVDI